MAHRMKIPSRFRLETVASTDLWVPTDDNGACLHIISQRQLDWDAGFNALEAVNKLSAGSVVFDVGAFVGDTTATFLRLGCEVHAFEPRPESFMCLLQNCPGAHCYNVALGNGSRFETTTEGGNIGGQPLHPGKRYSVPLDAFAVERMDFLKLDVEGMEGCVLRGGRTTITKLHPMVLLEFNPYVMRDFGDTPEAVQALLIELGYAQFNEVYRCHGPHGDHWDVVCT